MHQFKASRATGQYYGGREVHLERTVEDPGGWLCQVIAAANRDLVASGGSAGAGGEELPGFPWVTLVLGSGCLDSPEDWSPYLASLPKEVGNAAPPSVLGRTIGDEQAALVEFTRSLMCDRLDWRGPLPADDESVGPFGVDAEAVAVLRAATLLTALFHVLQAIRPRAFRRSGEDVARVEKRFHPDDFEELLVRLREVVSDLLSERNGSNDPLDRAETTVLASVQSGLTPAEGLPSVHADHVRQITELAWYRLTSGRGLYAGWSDLLHELSVKTNTRPARSRQPRPTVKNLSRTAELAASIYARVTKDSWEEQGGNLQKARASLYQAAATVLRAQAAFRTPVPESARPPLASAFVTGFDLELEMALWHSPEAQPFVVAVPVHLLTGALDDQISHPVWLGAVIRPDDSGSLASLLQPQEWFRLSGRSPSFRWPQPDPDSYEEDWGRVHPDGAFGLGDVPIVVRLSGAPLLELPDLGQERWAALRSDLLAQVRAEDEAESPYAELVAAVVVDEYVAMQLTAAELFDAAHPRVGFALPARITSATDLHSRYWLLLGVQMADPGIRHRLASQLSSPSMRTGPANGPVVDRAGLVVNRRLDAADEDLLFWLGFDVVRDDCGKYEQDLVHYVRHLALGRRSTRDRCPLPPGGVDG